jgi:hypothetical protein
LVAEDKMDFTLLLPATEIIINLFPSLPRGFWSTIDITSLTKLINLQRISITIVENIFKILLELISRGESLNKE